LHLGHPIVGDLLYGEESQDAGSDTGGEEKKAERTMLHACSMSILDKQTQEPVYRFVAGDCLRDFVRSYQTSVDLETAINDLI
jgi:hypothetical protein